MASELHSRPLTFCVLAARPTGHRPNATKTTNRKAAFNSAE